MDESRKCPVCGGEFEEGKYATFGNLIWYKETNGLLGQAKDPKKLIVHRCKSCGYLESYAK